MISREAFGKINIFNNENQGLLKVRPESTPEYLSVRRGGDLNASFLGCR